MATSDILERALRYVLDLGESEELRSIDPGLVARIPDLCKRLQRLGGRDGDDDELCLLYFPSAEFSDLQQRDDWETIKAFLNVLSIVPDCREAPRDYVLEMTSALWALWTRVRSLELGLPVDPRSVITGIAIDSRDRHAVACLSAGLDYLQEPSVRGDIFDRLRWSAYSFAQVEPHEHLVSPDLAKEWAALKPTIDQLAHRVRVFADEASAAAFAGQVTDFCLRFFQDNRSENDARLEAR
jgi:hypothetical protein